MRNGKKRPPIHENPAAPADNREGIIFFLRVRNNPGIHQPMEKVLTAMSGGVDSAVAALLLKERGCAVAGVYMKNWINEEGVPGNCRWRQDIEDARAAARALGIDFEVVNFMKEYRERVVRYLVDGYRRGLTPNPDAMCNREMKFGLLLDYARREGFEAVATGHYCRRQRSADGGWELWEGLDKNKDQSYFLALLKQEQLKGARFPAGKLTKPRVRELARRAGLPNAEKKDSQGICFIGDVRINDFLKKFIPDNPGEIVDARGRVLGEHRGLHRFTTGQRHGIGLPSNADCKHYVVTAKDLERNRLVVAFEGPDAPGLYKRRAELRDLSWLNRPAPGGAELLVKARYRDPSVSAHYEPKEGGRAELRFESPQRALAPGQVCALYDGERLLGGGIFA